MRGEGGECRLDGLGIADVGQERGENRKAGGGGRDRQAGLGHHGQQGGGLERDGLAARVGAADNHLPRRCSQLQRERNDLAAGCTKPLFEQRMTGRFKAKKIGRNRRSHAVVIAGKAGAGLQAVNQSKHSSAVHQPMGIAAHLPGEGDKDAMNLSLLVFQQAHQFVVLLDGFERLHVDRLPRRAGAVNYAANTALQFRADRNDEAVAANGDEVFLGGSVIGELAQGGTKTLFDEALLPLLLAANPAQLRRGIVGQRTVGLNGALDGFRKLAKTRGQRRRKRRQTRQLADQARRRRLQQRLPRRHVISQSGDSLQLVGFERRAGNLGFRSQLGGIEEAAEGDGNLFAQRQADLACELMLASDPGFVCRGFEIEDRVPAHGRGGKAGHKSQ